MIDLGAALLPKLVLFGLVLGRVTGVLLSLPMLGGEVVPLRFRAALAAVCAFALAAAAAPPAGLPGGAGAFVLALAGEVGVGAALGLVVRFAIGAAESAGSLIGLQMGLGFAGMVDPITQAEGPIGALFALAAWAMFVALDGHHEILRALADSLRALPAGAAASAAGGPLAARLVDGAAGLFASALRLAAPITAMLLAANVAVALIARVAPRVNLLALSFLVTVGAGLLLLATSAPAMGRALAALIQGALADARALAVGR